MESTYIKGNRCPACGHSLDGAAGDGAPAPDDFSLCVYCTTILQFNDDLTLRRVEDKDIPYSVIKARDKFIIFKRVMEAKNN